MNFIDLLPLLIFRMVGKTQGSWQTAFYYGALVALVQIAFRLYQQKPTDYIALGVNCFLIYGAAGYAVHQALLKPYDIFEESTIFLFIVIIGIITTIFAKDGFLQLAHKDQAIVRRGSLYLLAMACGALIFSYYCMVVANQSSIVGLIVPFILLVLFKERLQLWYLKQ